MGSIDYSSSSKYAVKDHWLSQPKHLRMICVGAGPAGLCFAYKMKEKFRSENCDLICYEKNAGVGGTWFENRYPGCTCDIPSHIYTYSFAPNPDWSAFYVTAPEIRRYFEDFAAKHNLLPHIQFNSKILKAVWHEEEGIYKVDIERDGEIIHDWCHAFVSANGIVNDWKLPDIEGVQDFKGPLMHTANWDETIDLSNKRVAVIGSGPSAIQVIPQVQKVAKHLTAVMRSATWIFPMFGGEKLQEEIMKNNEGQPSSGSAQYIYSQEERRRFREDPQYHLNYRKEMEATINLSFDLFIAGSELSKGVEAYTKAEMLRKIGEGHEELKAGLLPKWAPGCRRPSPGDGFLEAVTRPNVTTVHKDITRITETGMIDADGVFHEVDIIICGTGFKLPFKPPFEIVGVDGLSMDDYFEKEGPQVYLGTTVPHFPNFFIINGVGGGWAAGLAIPLLEAHCEYILRCCRKIQQDHIRALEVKQEPVTQLWEHIDEWHKRSVWNLPCKSSYKNNTVDGRLWIWGGSALHFRKVISCEPRYEHYDVRYVDNNMWSFLGNGRVKAEVVRAEDPTELIASVATGMRNDDCDFEI